MPMRVRFRLHETEPDPSSEELLREFVRSATEGGRPFHGVRVIGYASFQEHGEPELALARAEVVRRQLIDLGMHGRIEVARHTPTEADYAEERANCGELRCLLNSEARFDLLVPLTADEYASHLARAREYDLPEPALDVPPPRAR